MAIPSPSFLAGLVVLACLASFILLAIVRVTTGVSIQRFGLSSIHRIKYTLRDGIKVEIRRAGLTIHTPTFAQPTWLSLALSDFQVTIDAEVLGRGSKTNQADTASKRDGEAYESGESESYVPQHGQGPEPAGPERSRTWERLMKIKERIKRLQNQLHYIQMIDVIATNSSCRITDVGNLQIGSLTMAVDTRSNTVNRSRFFLHKTIKDEQKRPAEWIFTLRSLLFTPDGKEACELLDHGTLNIHGMLHKDLEGLRDASVALNLGRLHIPYDDLRFATDRIKHYSKKNDSMRMGYSGNNFTFQDIVEELDRPGSQDREIVQTVSDSKEFVASILRGVQEVQFAINFAGFTKAIHPVQPADSLVYFNVATKEVSIDLTRMDPKSPAHRMYFSPKDIAHQALIAAVSISLCIDDEDDHPRRLVYVPMATATVRTTLPSKTIQPSDKEENVPRNDNILAVNTVITSPSVDLDPKHLPLVLALLQRSSQASAQPSGHRHQLIPRLLPKAGIKLSVHEPVIRIALPPADTRLRGEGDFDLLILVMSDFHTDIESSHSDGEELHYSVAATLRTASNRLYYQTATGEKYNLLLTGAFEVGVQLSATPTVQALFSGSFQTLQLYMVRPEISNGVRRIVRELRAAVKPEKIRKPKRSRQENLLRNLPAWLIEFSFQGSDFSIEIAGTDPDFPQQARGVSLQLESWTAEYKAYRIEAKERRPMKRRSTSMALLAGEALPSNPEPPPRHEAGSTDGRRLVVHIHGSEASIIQSSEKCEPESLLNMPRFEVALTTSSDNQGPVVHVNSHLKSLFLLYSLYRHYALGVAVTVWSKTFGPEHEKADGELDDTKELSESAVDGQHKQPLTKPAEIVTIDIKASFVQIKATMPDDPPMMLQCYDLYAGRHRWTAPFGGARLVRLYVEAPLLKSVWERIVSIRNPRLDLREVRKKIGQKYPAEKSLDVTSDAIRIAVPHQLVMHKVFDNFINVLKTTKQLHHRFVTNTNEYILVKHPEGPKHVPKVSVRTQAFVFEIDDGAFEWKLGVIYRVGMIEQKQRTAREEAFRLKVKKMEAVSGHRSTSRVGTQSTRQNGHARSASAGQTDDQHGKNTSHKHGRGRSSSPLAKHDRSIRYDPSGVCGFLDFAKRTAGQAWEKLQHLNARSWKKRIDHALTFQKDTISDIRALFLGMHDIPDVEDQKEEILSMPQRPALMVWLMSDVEILIDKPSFPIVELPQFMHRVGKGIPYDTKYTLLMPMHVQINTGEARVTLRDYPLPLLHIPAIRPGQSPRLPSWSWKTDFVIGEEFQDHQSTRHVGVMVMPPEKLDPNGTSGGFAIDVQRTVSPVKTYSDIKIDVNTGYATKFTWGSSYQPAIQDMMQVFENFTKPQLDPSERVGFWDKIRLNFHSRVNVAWKGDGDVHLAIKGSRDPYAVTGTGAGFLLVWRNDVRWSICQDDDPRKFMIVDSGDFVLAVPDFNHFARQMKGALPSDSRSSIDSEASTKSSALFKKAIMKLSGNVKWLAGLVFERDTENLQRSFRFLPHYNVQLKDPHFAKALDGETYDAFRGFRSNHIHMSIAIAAPTDRDWSVTNLKPSSNYNSVHLSPRFFSHFFDWWSMFSGIMSLPIRQGSLWPAKDKSKMKFGRHLATFKYNLLLSPLFVSHVYKHKEAEDYSDHVVKATGLKLRLDSFILDVHQRREHFKREIRGLNKQIETSGMRINECQLDFISADLRALAANITGTNTRDLEKATDATLADYQQDTPNADLSRFVIPDNDFAWIDMDDFVELDWILPAESNPETKILPLAFAPRFTYSRETEHNGTISGDPNRHSPFGHEPTHFCVMSTQNDPRRVQSDLISERLQKIHQQMSNHTRDVNERELKVVQDGGNDAEMQSKLDLYREQCDVLERKKEFLDAMLKSLDEKLDSGDPSAVPEPEKRLHPESGGAKLKHNLDAHATMFNTVADIRSFNNRFIVHNSQIKWSNSLRDIILRYIHQVSQRRGFVYYMSRRAVKFILDIVEEQSKSKSSPSPAKDHTSRTSSSSTPSADKDEDLNVQSRIEQLLRDGKRFVNADDPETPQGPSKPSADNMGENISKQFTPQNIYHFRLIAPQIQLQSEKNSKAVVLLTAKSMQLKVIKIMDKDRVADEVSGLVQDRFSAEMDNVQFFVTSQKTFSTKFLHLYSGNRYGAPAGSSWPPWVPMEVMFDFHINPHGFTRVIQRTSASLRYDKYNTLRLKYNDDISKGEGDRTESPTNRQCRMDRIWVDFPRIRAICDSTQYYAIYIIVFDLILYSEPLEKVRNERLEKIMLASDFSDLRGAPEMVTMLQERIRQLEEIKLQFDVHEKFLDRQGWLDRISMDQDLTSCEDELFFIMKAITTSQRRSEERHHNPHESGVQRWYMSSSEIVWHLVRQENEPLIEFQLQHAAFERTDNNDGSNLSSVQIGRFRGLNLLPDALYPEMIAPFFDETRSITEGRDTKMLRVHWYMLEAIAGIPVMDHFEVNLFPLKIQLEREVGKRLFEYIFPGVGSAAFDSGGFSPSMIKQIPSPPEDDDSAHHENRDPSTSRPQEAQEFSPGREQGVGSGTGSIDARLTPTLKLPDKHRAKPTESGKTRLGYNIGSPRFTLFHSNGSKSARLQDRRRSKGPAEASSESLDTASQNYPYQPSNNHSGTSEVKPEKDKASKRFAFHKPSGRKDRTGNGKGKNERSDDLSQMMARASSYMTVAYFNIPSVVLCLSYKGKGQRNVEDVHNLVFRMPTIEYRNKTWSNLDMALQLKRDVIRALISHTGAIIGNKLTHHRPTKAQQSRLRDLASHSQILASSQDLARTESESSSLRGRSPAGRSSASAAGGGSQPSLISVEESRPSQSDSRSSLHARRGPSQGYVGGTAARTGAETGLGVGLGISDALQPTLSTHREFEEAQIAAEEQRRNGNALSKHLSALNLKAREREGIHDESEESTKKKSVLLFGKKILHALPHH